MLHWDPERFEPQAFADGRIAARSMGRKAKCPHEGLEAREAWDRGYRRELAAIERRKVRQRELERDQGSGR